MHQKFTSFLLFLTLFFSNYAAQPQVISVGNGSYTTTFPGTDEAGRNGFPSGTPQLSGDALNKPVPTNDWWSKLVKENHADNLFNYPMTMKTTNKGLIVTYIPWGVIGDSAPIEVGLSGMSVTKTTVSDYSDWTVTMNWKDNAHEMSATSGIGMPFIYFTKQPDDIVEVNVKGGTATLNGEMLIIENASSGADFVFYAPSGSTWSQNGTVFGSDMGARSYWSMAMLPQSTQDVNTTAAAFKEFAFVFPTNTSTTWSYDPITAKVKTNFTVETAIKEGTGTMPLIGLLPHQWSNLHADSPLPDSYSYSSIRGELKMMVGTHFSVENTFRGILPTLPYLANYSDSFSPATLSTKVKPLANEGLATWTDSYNEGQVMNRLIQTARIADQMGDTLSRDKLIATIKERLEDWLTYESGEVAFLFYYNSDWSAMLGYPAGHGQDNNINDHHFHWGYFIHAAAFMEQFEPGWVDQWGVMVNHLIRDAASADRNDDLFPFLRNFSPYAGHCWANGFASFPQGNDQESTSESMQFNSSLIHWGTITGNDEIRDLGIYLYTTEQTAIEEYWFDIHERNFPANQPYALVSRVWGNSMDNGTFWTSDITASYGIEMYPIHGGSMYLGHHPDYVTKIWNELESYTGILNPGETNPNLWHDVFWKYLSFIDPQKAIALYELDPDRILKFGVSDAQTYHWLHAMNAMGTLRPDILADYPIAVAFEKEGQMTYVAHNYTNQALVVNYSDGYQMTVPAGQMATSKDVAISAVLSSDFKQAYANGSVRLTVDVNGSADKVAFYDDSRLISELVDAPYELEASDLSLGIHQLYARVYDGENFVVTNIIPIQVGEQVPFDGIPLSIPGVIEAGNYDLFEGGKGAGISYEDTSPGNNGNYRLEEDVDAVLDNSEGATIGWIASGEWTEYTVDVPNPGVYSADVRYASGNANGGGPFYFEVNDRRISDDITLNSTSSTNWDTWATKTVSGLELYQGVQTLRLRYQNGEFNLGKITLTRTGDLSYGPPVADAGANVSVVLPSTTATLNGNGSSDPDQDPLHYAWSQIYGPSIVAFSDASSVSPELSNLDLGIYKFELKVDDGTYSSTSTVLVIVTETGNNPPAITLTSPKNNSTFREGSTIVLEANASDLDGSVNKVEFFSDNLKIGEDTNAPFSYSWTDATVGDHLLKAVVTDDAGATDTAELVMISVEEVKACQQAASEAQQGDFSTGYQVTFETVGNQVTIIFELLDTDKQGVVAYLWQKDPFSETPMDQIAANTFSKTVTGLTTGTTISYACKFAFAGGLAVTKYFDYQVGSDCDATTDTEAPQNFSVNVGTITSSAVELLLNATDNSGEVIFMIQYENQSTNITVKGGSPHDHMINALESEKSYSFVVTATDLMGNVAENGPITVTATTLVNTNTPCSGNDFAAQQGQFSVGYSYAFETLGSDVKITFELQDQVDGVVAYLRRQTPFMETQMTLVSGKTFTATINGLSNDEVITYACKFAFAGGLAVTKYFTYQVGDDCLKSTLALENGTSLSVFPNPTKEKITVQLAHFSHALIFDLSGKKLIEFSTPTISIAHLKKGVYLLNVYDALGHSYIQKVAIE